MSSAFTRIGIRIGMRHFNLTVDDAHEIYKTLKTIFDPEEKAKVHELFQTDKAVITKVIEDNRR